MTPPALPPEPPRPAPPAAPPARPEAAAHPAGPGPLGALRAELDALDDALHDLVMARAAIVARLAGSRVKGSGPPLRPGREAAILRRLLARHRGPLPAPALVGIWRALLAATSAMQGGLRVAVAGGSLAPAARGQFGVLAPLRAEPAAAAALAALAVGEADLAVLPLPGEADGDWWAGGTGRDGDGPSGDDPWGARLHVVARLPFPAAPGVVGALLASVLPPDPSGDDLTLLRLDAPPARAAAALAAAGLAPAAPLAAASPSGPCLAAVAGFLAADDPRLAALAVPVRRLGAHPRADAPPPARTTP